MARKGWQSLSAEYKARLEKGGVSRSDYEGGQSIQKARGHGATPENPRQYDPQKYQKYHTTRTQLESQLEVRKRQLYGNSARWDATASARNIRNYAPSLAQIRWAMSADDDELLDAIRESPGDYAWLGYH
jgi:hypothetical protein